MTQPMNQTEIAAAVAAGANAVEVAKRFHVWKLEDGSEVPIGLDREGNIRPLRELQAIIDERQPQPRRRRGESEHTELESFIRYVNDYKLESKGARTVAFASPQTFRVEAVLDYHPKGDEGAGWSQHSASYTCPRSPEWIAWTAMDGKPMSQDGFANFLEERLDDLRAGDKATGVYPKPVEVLEMARNLQVHQQGRFTRKVDPTTGTGTLVVQNEHSAESTKIHRAFLLGLRVFEGGAPYAVEARIRFVLVNNQTPQFAYVLHRRAEVERDAFTDVRRKVEDGCKIVVFAGVREGRDSEFDAR